MKRSLTFIFGILFALPAMAELITVSGTVEDNEGPLIGAMILISGTNNAVTSSLDGKFTIKNVPSDAKAEISYIGYKKQTLPVTGISAIKLEEDVTNIDDVVVIGKHQSRPCTTDQLPTNAASGMTQLPPAGQTGLLCIIDKCKDGYDLADNKCESTSCKKLPAHATAGTRSLDAETKKETCTISACKEGFDLKENKCVSASGPCDASQLPENAATGSRVRRDNKEICVPDTCVEGYEVVDDKCSAVAGKCPKDLLPANAVSGTRSWDAETKKEICTADNCNEGYKLTDGKCESKLSEQESAKKVSELRDNALAMKEKENSTANKLLGAAAIGAGGIGGSQLLSAQAEKNADAEAERDMKAYLATFRCDFGQGKNIKGGEKGLVLPGGNDLMPLYTEYKSLAANLKTTKDALGMKPGIEAETVFDKANTGLYDNESIGRQSGAFSSLSRALSDSSSADAAGWADQKSATASKSKTGMAVAAVGIVGGAVGNVLINNGKNATKESSEKINNKYKDASNDKSDAADKSKNDAESKPQTESKDDVKSNSDAESKPQGEPDKASATQKPATTSDESAEKPKA